MKLMPGFGSCLRVLPLPHALRRLRAQDLFSCQFYWHPSSIRTLHLVSRYTACPMCLSQDREAGADVGLPPVGVKFRVVYGCVVRWPGQQQQELSSGGCKLTAVGGCGLVTGTAVAGIVHSVVNM